MRCAPFRLFIHSNWSSQHCSDFNFSAINHFTNDNLNKTVNHRQLQLLPQTKGTKPRVSGFVHHNLIADKWGEKKVSQLSDDIQQRAIFFVNVVALNCWMMGLQTMEQQAAPGMARALPTALDCSNDSLSTSSRCLPFKAGQVNKVSLSKSINRGLFTH